jgi:F1F0 ATPase subunit 2
MIFAFLWGLFLALMFFGGLWLTVRILPRMGCRREIGLCFSFFLRVLLVLAGMGILVKSNPLAFFIAFGSFMLARPVLVRSFARV